MNKLQLSIPKPCHENWQLMTPTEKGKFCGACQKNVFDFTRATDREIIQAYNNDQNLCGRFLNTQLDRELTFPKEKKTIWLASVFFGIISLANTKVVAQEIPKTKQTQTKHLLGKPIQDIKKQVSEEKTMEIQGNVLDEFGGPLPGVNVIVKGTRNGTNTGFKGEYKITASKGDILEFSFMGMKVEERTVSISNYINIKMDDDVKILGGEVVCVYNKRTFLGRKFQKIRNWFR